MAIFLISCRILCTSNTTDASVLHPIRSYRSRGAPAPSCTILEAACACIASPYKFDPVVIGKGHRRVTLIDAIIGYANPAKELLREAQDVFGEHTEVSSLVSLGTGKGDIKVAFEGGKEVGIGHALRRGMAMSEQVHEDLETRLHETGIYFRFNVEKSLDERPDVVLVHTSSYLREKATSIKVDEATKSFYGREKGVMLRDISMHDSYAVSFELTIRRFGNGD
jgi:hypothetical protein